MKKMGKLVAPIIVTIILVSYFIGFLILCLNQAMPPAVQLIGGIICLALIGVTIFVVSQRIQEIRSGEEDDLSKY